MFLIGFLIYIPHRLFTLPNKSHKKINFSPQSELVEIISFSIFALHHVLLQKICSETYHLHPLSKDGNYFSITNFYYVIENFQLIFIKFVVFFPQHFKCFILRMVISQVGFIIWYEIYKHSLTYVALQNSATPICSFTWITQKVVQKRRFSQKMLGLTKITIKLLPIYYI